MSEGQCLLRYPQRKGRTMAYRATCPKCNSASVKPVMMWRMASADGTVQAPPQPMFACQDPSCLHKWARPTDTKACEHTVECLIDVSFSDGSLMGRYACAECGKESIRPYQDYPHRPAVRPFNPDL